MQENEFEKQVKQKMDEFRLRPSEPVWLEVRKELVRKRRRRLLVLIPLFAALLAVSYLTLRPFISKDSIPTEVKNVSANNKNDNKVKPAIDNDKKLNNRTDEPVNRDAVANKESKTADEKKNDNVSIKEETESAKSKNNEKRKLTVNKSTSIVVSDIPAKKKGNDIVKNDFSEKTNKKRLSDKQVDGYSASTADRPLDKTADKKIADSRSLNNNGNEQPVNEKDPAKDIAVINTVNNIDNSPVPILSDFQRKIITDSLFTRRLSDVQVPVINNQRFSAQRNLKIGFTLAVGASSRANKPLQLAGSSSSDKALPSAFYGPGSNANGGVLASPPSDVKPGVAFKAGLTIMKPVSRRFDIAAGLLYSYSSDHIRIGKSFSSYITYNNRDFLNIQAQSTAVSGKNTDYTNKYHFIELPVSAYFKLTGKWKRPLIWNAGVSVSQLISSNALLYDAALGGVYYDGKRDINKTQLNLSTGFSLRFYNNSGWQWNIGPQIYLSATKLFNNAYDENKHPVYGGLHMQVLLPTKKKSRK